MSRRMQHASGPTPALLAGAAISALAIAIGGLVFTPAASATPARSGQPAAAPALSLAQCQAEAKRRGTSCLSTRIVPGNRCTSSQNGKLALTSTGSLVACKRSWGSVYVWMWA